jgi:hypothetical protein
MVTYYTKLDIEECKKRINEVVKKNRFSICEIKGKVNFKKDTFYLVKPREFFNNSFARIFCVKMLKKEHGTIIQGSFSINIFTKIFMTMYFVFLFSVDALALSICFSGTFWGMSYGEGILNQIVALVAPVIMIMFGIFIVKYGVWFGKDEEKYVLEFIKTTLDLKEIETQIKLFNVHTSKIVRRQTAEVTNSCRIL